MSRAEAVVRLERWLDSAKKQVNDFEAVFRGSTSSWRGDAECFEMAIAALKEQNVTDINVGNKWISVKDRLPESGTHVLICCEIHRYGGGIAGKYVCDGFYAEANKLEAGGFPDECDCEYSEEDDEYYLREGWYEVIKNWDDYNSVTIGDFVTHWMYLPEPPKEDAG